MPASSSSTSTQQLRTDELLARTCGRGSGRLAPVHRRPGDRPPLGAASFPASATWLSTGAPPCLAAYAMFLTAGVGLPVDRPPAVTTRPTTPRAGPVGGVLVHDVAVVLHLEHDGVAGVSTWRPDRERGSEPLAQAVRPNLGACIGQAELAVWLLAGLLL